MPANKETIKKVIDSFEEDDFVDAESSLKKELKKAKNDYLKKELDLENDVEEIEPDDDSNDNDDPDNGDDDSNGDGTDD